MTPDPNPRYPVETLPANEDCGVMPENVAALANAVVGHRIVSATQGTYGKQRTTIITLDNGKRVVVYGFDIQVETDAIDQCPDVRGET